MAGLMAAGEAALSGADVLVLEKMHRPARKLCITGKGRCNITNTKELPEFIERFGKTGSFLRQVFSKYFAPDLMEFFERLGCALVVERGGRVFPESGSAPEVAGALLKWAKASGAKIRSSSPVEGLIVRDERVVGVTAGGKEFFADAVIIATGGASYPDTGSTGDGYYLAKDAGHEIVPIRPALVPLETSGVISDALKKAAGLGLKNVGVRVYIDGKKKRETFGEMGFTEYGVDGPVINTLSGAIVSALDGGKKVAISIDLKPALDEKKLDARLLRDFAKRNTEPIESVLRGVLPKELVSACMELTEISPEKTPSSITAKERRQIKAWLKELKIEVSGYRPIAEAIVTAGGVNTREVDPRSMESRLVKGLYIVGELLDIQGDTGGYNLQAAFSTGWLAGRSAAEAEQRD